MKLYLFILSLFICLSIHAQINTAFSFGIVANNEASTYSNPILVSGKNCIQLTNGISKYVNYNTGTFDPECTVSLDYNSLLFEVFPNPVTDLTYLKNKINHGIDNNILYKITIVNEIGHFIKLFQVSGSQMMGQGYQMDLSNLIAGVYYIQLNSNQFVKSFKIIKN